MTTRRIEQAYNLAKERYAELGVDTEQAISRLTEIPLSLPCWQGDDLGGFEPTGGKLSGGGVLVTGNYPGKARTADELRADLSKAYSLIPGTHRLNMHAIHGEFDGKFVDRDAIGPDQFKRWVAWAKENNLKLDLNATFFSHPKASDGCTLSHRDQGVRDFWIEHAKRCREISAYIGRELQSPCVHNLWIGDGSKDIPADRLAPRTRLVDSLDKIYADHMNPGEIRDSVESKLFGIGAESYTVGSHEFYIAYALSRGLLVCIDTGHFHPTEWVPDKITSMSLFFPELLLHVTRGIRWDSDHVVILNDEIRALCEELVRADMLDRTYVALDFFDGSINRVAAWVIGSRAMLRGLLIALLEPTKTLVDAENQGRTFERLAIMEELKGFPAGDVWDYYCMKMGVPVGMDWIADVQKYETEVTNKR